MSRRGRIGFGLVAVILGFCFIASFSALPYHHHGDSHFSPDCAYCNGFTAMALPLLLAVLSFFLMPQALPATARIHKGGKFRVSDPHRGPPQTR